MSILRNIWQPDGYSYTEGKSPNNAFETAVVIDFISNPELYLGIDVKDDDMGDVKMISSLVAGSRKVDNESFIALMPRNSIIGRNISNGAGKVESNEIFFPFFPPHISLPVNPGEQVWCFYEKDIEGNEIGYWVSRKVAPIQIDDINYTHLDRISLEKGESPYTFPDGGQGIQENNTLVGDNPYEEILEDSLAFTSEFMGEPVPRFSKRCGDLVLQGSNNALICLGQDRYSNSSISIPKSNTPSAVLGKKRGEQLISATTSPIPQLEQASVEDPGGRGTIDMVVGRGQSPDTSAVGNPVKNIRPPDYKSFEWEEIDKFSQEVQDVPSNLNEGNPDLINDLSRFYLSMKTDGDINFDIGKTIVKIGDTIIDPSPEGSFAIVKSTNPRIIARQDGSIKIVHEKGSNIIMDSNGNLQIQCGSTIALGRDGSTPSSGGTTGIQPFVRGDDLESVLGEFMDQVSKALINIQVAFAANTSPFFGIPIPSLTTASVNTSASGGISDSGANIMTIKAKLGTIKSTVIKGE